MGKYSTDPDDVEAQFVEVDPSGRYGRYKEVLGKGAFKKVYRAFDELEGIEVAWNQVKVADLLKNSVDMERLYSEVHLLKTLKHKNIIKFYNSWVDAKSENINFITEIFTSGTLRQYRQKHKHVNLRALKKWSRQILEGLSYLHSHDPPVIHRDLKCDNIFVNGNQGEVKIGDLGLAAILQARSAHSVIGTPEFMAPELYEEEYDQLIDIYAFGMCLLELVTFEYPYVECTNAAQIYKKVTSGIRPASLVKVKDPEVRAFIEKCIAKVSDRLSARELLMDPFLYSDVSNESVGRSIRTNPHAVNSNNLDNGKNPEDAGLDSSRDFTVQGQRKDLNTVFLKLRIADSTGQIRNIHFPFDIEVDTSTAVASEMVEELDLTDQDASAISDMIDTEIRTYIPHWAAEELSRSTRNEVAMSDNSISEGQADSSPVTNLSSPINIVLERLPSGRKYWSVSPRPGNESSPVKPGPRLLSNQEETPVDSHTEEDIRSTVSSQHMDDSSEALLGKHGASVKSHLVLDSFPVTNLSSHPGSVVLERLPSRRKYWSVSEKASNGSSPVKPGPHLLSNQDMETSADSRTIENIPSSGRSEPMNDSSDEALLEMQEATVSSQNVVDSSPMTNIYSLPGSIVLEEPAEKNYHSVSPKGGGGSSPVKPGPRFLVDQVMETHADRHTKENIIASATSQHVDNLNDKPLLKNQEASVFDANLPDSKHKLPDLSLFGASALHLGNEPNSVLVNGKIPGDIDSDDDNILVKKLGHILVEHQRELNELKKKHELIVSDLLKELPLKIRNKFLRNFAMEEAPQNVDSDLPSPDSFSPIRLQNLNIALEGGKRNSEAGKIVCGPIFRDKFKTLKTNTKSDIGAMGIAVILSDNGVSF